MSKRSVAAVVAGSGLACAAWGQALPALKPAMRVVVTDGPGFSENFDALAAGTQLIGHDGWLGWANYPNDNPTALVVGSPASSAPSAGRLALANAGLTPPTDQTDCVQPLAVSGGQWVLSAMTYVPSAATNTGVQSPDPYLMLLRDYQGAASGTNHWGVQTHFDAVHNLVIEDDWLGGGTGVVGNAFTPRPLVKDQWVPWRAEIDLSASGGGRVKVYYNNLLVGDHKWHDQPATSPAAPYTLKALDLYDHGISDFFVDDLVLGQGGQGGCYANCDGSTGAVFLTVNDFVCFQSAFAAGASYANCDGSTTVPVLTVNDFVCFQSAFAAGCSAP